MWLLPVHRTQFLAGAQIRRGKAARQKFHQKLCKYATAVRAHSAGTGFEPEVVLLV